MNDQLTLGGTTKSHEEVVRERQHERAQAAKREAVDRVGANASEVWKARALDAVRRLAETGEPFTSDDVWERVGAPHEPRALGAVMRAAAQKGIAIPTADYRPSRRVECHARPVRVWRGT